MRRLFQIQLTCLFSLAVCLTAAEEMFDATALVTTSTGDIQITDAEGKSVSANIHKTLKPTGHNIRTDKQSALFLAHSNGTALGINEKTELNIIKYAQSPFPPEKESIELEPSVSTFSIQLIKGQIAIASDHISPLSNLRVHLANSELRLHIGSCLIEYSESGATIVMSQGNATFYYPNGEREFIASNQAIRISDQSAQVGHITEKLNFEEATEAGAPFTRATEHAYRRVIFKAPRRPGADPKPVLIVSPNYLEQAPLRPYQFKD